MYLVICHILACHIHTHSVCVTVHMTGGGHIVKILKACWKLGKVVVGVRQVNRIRVN